MVINGRIWNPGEMRTRIDLGRRLNTADAGGFDQPGYTVIDSVWCRWINAHGAEVWEAQAQGAIQPATVMIRYRSDIDVTWAIRKGTAWFEIVSLDDIRELHELIEMKVKRVVAG